MKRWCALFLAGLALQAWAEPPRIGRLFSSAVERDRLDRLREAGGRLPAAPVQVQPAQPVVVAPPPAPPPAPIAVSGIVKRSDGKSTVWINGTPQDDQQVGNANGATPAVTVVLPSGQRATVKAGQALDVTTGAVGDAPRQ